MTWNPFAWIRRRVAQAAAQGFSDFVQAIAPDEDEEPGTPVEDLRKQLAASLKALPAGDADEDEKAKKRK